MPEPLTSRQREILEYLRFRQKIRSYPPTVREIGEPDGLTDFTDRGWVAADLLTKP